MVGFLLIVIALYFLWIKCKDPEKFPNKAEIVPFDKETMKDANNDPNRTYLGKMN